MIPSKSYFGTKGMVIAGDGTDTGIVVVVAGAGTAAGITTGAAVNAGTNTIAGPANIIMGVSIGTDITMGCGKDIPLFKTRSPCLNTSCKSGWTGWVGILLFKITGAGAGAGAGV